MPIYCGGALIGSDLGIMVVWAAFLSWGGVVFPLPHPPSLDPHAFLCPIIPSNALAAFGYCIWSALSSCMPSISASLRPCCLSNCRNLLFSSSTLRAADCISALASTPTCSQVRYFVSSSWRYSLRRARERRWLSRMRAKLAVRYHSLSWPIREDSDIDDIPGPTSVLRPSSRHKAGELFLLRCIL